MNLSQKIRNADATVVKALQITNSSRGGDLDDKLRQIDAALKRQYNGWEDGTAKDGLMHLIQSKELTVEEARRIPAKELYLLIKQLAEEAQRGGARKRKQKQKRTHTRRRRN
jgi:hypothetical protein